ncbi:uncharacterized protein BT62DRAFT_1010435 [Guyanagaster necrorhizus]|uniref:Uncharacterized protein n=1 Tax=Guyanagaster necrorhizus TaxID=856835 RepID=A0A9P7VKU4_9AGAR|nr:uncharacterized protein BT62DRAFT_1010435 [Guyanagaster necrorhizus MCA 3950]KAG7442472.1 hypothetical protein BT62DRAFT_1010435 [Guyanagaster necrorhizus MCA 3950]
MSFTAVTATVAVGLSLNDGVMFSIATPEDLSGHLVSDLCHECFKFKIAWTSGHGQDDLGGGIPTSRLWAPNCFDGRFMAVLFSDLLEQHPLNEQRVRVNVRMSDGTERPAARHSHGMHRPTRVCVRGGFPEKGGMRATILVSPCRGSLGLGRVLPRHVNQEIGRSGTKMIHTLRKGLDKHDQLGYKQNSALNDGEVQLQSIRTVHQNRDISSWAIRSVIVLVV